MTKSAIAVCNLNEWGNGPTGEKQYWWEKYAEYYKLLTAPVLLAEQDALLCWANDAARGLGLDHAYAYAVAEHIFLPGNSTFFDEMQLNSTIRIPLDELLEGPADFCLSRVYEGESPLGFIVVVRPRAQTGENRLRRGIERNISTFAYQMRGPISAIFSAVSGIQRSNNTEYEDPTLREYTAAIAANGYLLLRTNMHITQFYRYKYGKQEFLPRQQDLVQFLERLCRMVSVMIEAKDLRFRFQWPKEPVLVHFDAAIINAVVLELVSNAAKFSAEDGEISVSLQTGADSVAVSVTDNGLGISERVIGSVFGAFFSHDPRTEGVCGDGLGLWLCREGVRAHGGNIVLESREGSGTRVVFTLPYGESAAGAPLGVHDLAADYLYDRFSDLFVILSDVCKVPEQ